MKFTLKKSEIIKPMNIVRNIINTKSMKPILQNMMIQLDGGSMTLEGSDLEVGIRYHVGEVETETISVFSGRGPGRLIPSPDLQFCQLQGHTVPPSADVQTQESTSPVQEHGGLLDVRGFRTGRFRPDQVPGLPVRAALHVEIGENARVEQP